MTARSEATKAAYAARSAQRSAALIEDVEELIAAKEWPERIATRLGYKAPYCLERKLNELGRRDLTLKMRQLDQTSTAYQLAHYTPMDEVVARERVQRTLKDKEKRAA